MNHGYEVFHTSAAVLVDFYRDVLAFTLDGDPDPQADYIAVRRDHLIVGCCAHPDAPTTHRPPPAGSEIVLRVHDIQAEHDRVVDSGWPIEDPLTSRPWGLVDFRLYDPSGQYIRITETRQPA